MRVPILHQLHRHAHSSEHLHEGCDRPLEVQASGLQLLRLALGRRQIFCPIFDLLAQIPDLACLGLRLGLAPGAMESMSRVWLFALVALASGNDPALPRERRGLHSQLVLQLTDFLEVRLCLGPERIPLPRCVSHQALGGAQSLCEEERMLGGNSGDVLKSSGCLIARLPGTWLPI